MKLNKVLLGIAVVASFNVLATKPAPVVNVNNQSTPNLSVPSTNLSISELLLSER